MLDWWSNSKWVPLQHYSRTHLSSPFKQLTGVDRWRKEINAPEKDNKQTRPTKSSSSSSKASFNVAGHDQIRHGSNNKKKSTAISIKNKQDALQHQTHSRAVAGRMGQNRRGWKSEIYLLLNVCKLSRVLRKSVKKTKNVLFTKVLPKVATLVHFMCLFWM